MSSLNLGLIGLDTSHVEALAAVFNDPDNAHHLPGARIVAAFPGGSPDFPLSIERMPRYTEKLRAQYGIKMLGSPREVAAAVDAILLTSVDGRVHLQQFGEISSLRRPTFLDKPFATTSQEAQAIAALAKQHGTPLFSSSNLRFAAALQTAVREEVGGRVIGADFSGPMTFQPTQPGYFWYGIHTVEMLFTACGPGCESVRAFSTEEHEVLVGRWRDGRLGVARGNRAGNGAFTGVVHREKIDQWVDAAVGRPAHLGLAQAILGFFQGGPAPVPLDETVEIIRFLEAANESRGHEGREVKL